jgi:hypothetical protein
MPIFHGGEFKIASIKAFSIEHSMFSGDDFLFAIPIVITPLVYVFELSINNI